MLIRNIVKKWILFHLKGKWNFFEEINQVDFTLDLLQQGK